MHDDLPADVAPNATDTPVRGHQNPSTGTKPNIRLVALADPFLSVEGVTHHRSPARLAQRIRELEADNARLQNRTSDLADIAAAFQAALVSLFTLGDHLAGEA